jgi:hypothetical protein
LCISRISRQLLSCIFSIATEVIMAVKHKMENNERVSVCAWWYTSVRQSRSVHGGTPASDSRSLCMVVHQHQTVAVCARWYTSVRHSRSVHGGTSASDSRGLCTVVHQRQTVAVCAWWYTSVRQEGQM